MALDEKALIADMTDWRRDLHRHPEFGFEERRTSAFVAQKLCEFGLDEVVEGVGGTGVVGTLRRGSRNRAVALRADMDALRITEQGSHEHISQTPGVMHACGHDGHTTMLLGAAKYLAETRDFDGTAVFIFQPAEEGLGGARAMLADGLFSRFPCDEVYGLHNNPGGRFGELSVRTGAAMAAADFFDIRIVGRGAHGAQPHRGVDPVVVQAALVQALQTIVSRNADPLQSAVLSITQVHAGAAYNVIPEEAHLAGTIRTFDDDIRALVAQRMREIAAGIAATFGAEIVVDIRNIFSVLRNSEAQTQAAAAIATELFGAAKVDTAPEPKMGSEDFADMLLAVPGTYAWLDGKAGAAVHNAAYDFDDAIIPLGAAYLARLVERRSAA